MSNSRLIYVEPNDVILNEDEKEEVTYGRINGVPITPDYTKLCMSVNLEVEKHSRIPMDNYASEQSGNTTYSITWQSTYKKNDSIYFSFLEGEKVDEKHNYLSTYYTNPTFHDVYENDKEDKNKLQRGKIVEGLGIESINITFENYFIPIITIKFIDVRGTGFFGREEAIHDKDDNLTAENMFGGFFTFPYPRFRLTVKGFYGKPVTYQMVCKSFDGAFNSQTGNFELTVTFIGYQFSLLSDVRMSFLLAAPYVKSNEYDGEAYWNRECSKDKLKTNGWGMYVRTKNNDNPIYVKPLRLFELLQNINSASAYIDAYKKTFTEESLKDDKEIAAILLGKGESDGDFYQSFAPYIGNIFKLIMCHLETFMYLIYKCADNIMKEMETDNGRTFDRLGITEGVLEKITCAYPTQKENYNTKKKQSKVYPFPAIYADAEVTNTERVNSINSNAACGYPGMFANKENWEEYKFVEALYKAIQFTTDKSNLEKEYGEVETPSESIEEYYSGEGEDSVLKKVLIISDIIYGQTGYSKTIVSNPYSLVTHLATRMYILFCCTDISGEIEDVKEIALETERENIKAALKKYVPNENERIYILNTVKDIIDNQNIGLGKFLSGKYYKELKNDKIKKRIEESAYNLGQSGKQVVYFTEDAAGYVRYINENIEGGGSFVLLLIDGNGDTLNDYINDANGNLKIEKIDNENVLYKLVKGNNNKLAINDLFFFSDKYNIAADATWREIVQNGDYFVKKIESRSYSGYARTYIDLRGVFFDKRFVTQEYEYTLKDKKNPNKEFCLQHEEVIEETVNGSETGLDKPLKGNIIKKNKFEKFTPIKKENNYEDYRYKIGKKMIIVPTVIATMGSQTFRYYRASQSKDLKHYDSFFRYEETKDELYRGYIGDDYVQLHFPFFLSEKTNYKYVLVYPNLISNTAIDFNTIINNEIHPVLDTVYNEQRSSVDSENVAKEKSEENTAKESKDAKVGIYMYLQNLWNKWLCIRKKTDYNVSTFFANFSFIDSFYLNTANKIHINVETLLKIYNGSMFEASLFHYLGDIASKHGCMIFALPDVVDLGAGYGRENNAFLNMQKMFQPHPYNEVLEKRRENNFVVMYAHSPASSNREETEDGVSDVVDSFNLYKDESKLPKVFSLDYVTQNEQGWNEKLNQSPHYRSLGDGENPLDDSLYGYYVPSFAVAYSRMNNHLFTGINVSMKNPITTEYSIKAISNILENASGNNHKVVFHGQDLYPVYANYAYECTVQMMGNAQITPLMYFQLMNIPLFRGAYMIYKVSHSITPGDFTTTFQGIKMSKRFNKYAAEWFTEAWLNGATAKNTYGYETSIPEQVNNYFSNRLAVIVKNLQLNNNTFNEWMGNYDKFKYENEEYKKITANLFNEDGDNRIKNIKKESKLPIGMAHFSTDENDKSAIEIKIEQETLKNKTTVIKHNYDYNKNCILYWDGTGNKFDSENRCPFFGSIYEKDANKISFDIMLKYLDSAMLYIVKDGEINTNDISTFDIIISSHYRANMGITSQHRRGKAMDLQFTNDGKRYELYYMAIMILLSKYSDSIHQIIFELNDKSNFAEDLNKKGQILNVHIGLKDKNNKIVRTQCFLSLNKDGESYKPENPNAIPLFYWHLYYLFSNNNSIDNQNYNNGKFVDFLSMQKINMNTDEVKEILKNFNLDGLKEEEKTTSTENNTEACSWGWIKEESNS